MVRNEVSPSISRTRAASVAEFVIYCDFDSVEFATTHLQEMRLVIGVPGDVTVLAGNVQIVKTKSLSNAYIPDGYANRPVESQYVDRKFSMVILQIS
jgi:hypothetical protein